MAQIMKYKIKQTDKGYEVYDELEFLTVWATLLQAKYYCWELHKYDQLKES